MSAPTAGPVLCPIIVSRASELAALDRALAEAKAGRGGVVFLVGEPGIGKTRLSHEMETRAQDAGMTVLRGRAVASAAPVPFRPLAEALAPAVRSGGVAADLGAARPLLEPLLSERSREAGANRFFIFDATGRLLARIADGRGLLLVFEDLHWADGDTLDFVDHLAENLSDQPIVCVCTMRDDPGPSLERAETLAARRAALLLRLARLSPGDVAEMTRVSLGVETVPPSLIDVLTARAEGVPFIIEEMLTSYVASGGRVSAATTIPQTFRELVRARLDTLDEGTRQVVSAAAIIGRRFEWSLLTAITGLERPQVLEALRRALRAQLIVTEAGRFEMPFEFRHALVREAVVGELLPPERAELSATAAAAIEERFPELPGEWCERAAELREAAGDTTAAGGHLQEAARRALARGAFASAEAMLEHARALVAGDKWHIIGIDRQLVDVLTVAGKVDRLREIGSAALTFVQEKRSRMPFMRLGLGDLHLRLARGMVTAGDDAASDEHLEQARAFAAESGEMHLIAGVRILEAQRAMARGDAEAALAAAQEAIEAAKARNLREVTAEALSVEGRAAFLAGDADRSLATLRRARDEAPPRSRVGALLDLGEITSYVEGSVEILEEARKLAAETGAVSSEARADLLIGSAHVDRFALEDAARPLARCIETCRRYRLAMLSDALEVEAQRLALIGSEADAEAAISEAGDASAARAVLALLREEHDDARAVAAASSDPVTRSLAALLGEPIPETTPAHTLAAGLHAFAAAARSADGSEWADADARLEGFPWWRRIARRIVAEAALRDGWGDPVAWIRESLSFFEAAGHERIASACKALLRRAGAPVPRKGRGEAAVPVELGARGVTSREMDVLRLIGDGLGNRDIAKRLFLSPRTIETHVASLLRKLDAADRAALVAVATEARRS